MAIDEHGVQSCRLSTIDRISCRERLGIGWLEARGAPPHFLASRYTQAVASEAHRFARFCQRYLSGDRNVFEEPVETAPSLPTGSVVAPSHRSLMRLGRFLRRRWSGISLGLGLTLASTLAAMVPPYLTMPLVDEVLIPRQNGVPVPYSLAIFYLLGLAVAAFLGWILGWARSYVMAWVGERISADLRVETYAHLQSLSVDFHSSKRTGDLIARLSSDTDRICNFLGINLVDFTADILLLVATITVLVAISPGLALAALLPFPLIALLVYAIRERLRKGFQRGTRAWGTMTAVLADTIPGIRVVKAFAQEQREIDRFRASNHVVLQANDVVHSVWSFTGPTIAFLSQLGLLVVWLFGASLVFEQSITVGVLTAFLAYMTRFYGRLEALTRIVQTTQRAAASAERIFEILDRQSSVPEPIQPIEPAHPRGAIEIRHVSFHYGARTVLKDLSISIRPGEMIGLVGPSGAGKTTLINLLCRMYDVAEGSILVDGVDVRRFPVKSYRRQLGLVLQDPFLFHGTVAENISYGRPDASAARIIEAARAASAHEFILRFLDGYDALVGERGQALSGGERQRISIARALLIDPSILILDEATSSVDTETERLIQEALERLIKGRTTIAIAHRLSTLRRADRLVVLDQGRIVEVGTHDDLIRREGPYTRLYRAQALGLVDDQGPTSTPHGREQGDAEGKPASAKVSKVNSTAIQPPRRVATSDFQLLCGEVAGRGLTVVLPGGEIHTQLEPIRAFPWTYPERWIFLCDSEGREVAFVEDLNALPSERQEMLRRELAARVFVPEIQRIESISSVIEPSDWAVQTDRGQSKFRLSSHDDIRRLSADRFLITDQRGMRYLIPSLGGLDPRSRALLERLV